MNDYIYDDGGRHKYFQMKYKKDRVGDCVIRALSIATKEDYQSVRSELWEHSLEWGYAKCQFHLAGVPQKRGFKEAKIKGIV